MIDVALLAGNAWTALQPFIPILSKKAVDEIGKKVPDAITKVWDSIKIKFEAKPAASEAIDDLGNLPEDPDTQASFRKELKKILTEDQSFAAELSKLLEAAGQVYTATLTGDGAIAQGDGSVAVGKGGVHVGGDVKGNITTGGNSSSDIAK